MIFGIFLILIAISVIFLILNDKIWYEEWIDCVCWGVLIPSAIVAIIMSIFVIDANVGIEGKIASDEQRYEALVYQVENEIYENDNDVGKYELYNQVREWNEDLAKGKAMQNDFWLGIFYPDIFDKFEFIELK